MWAGHIYGVVACHVEKQKAKTSHSFKTLTLYDCWITQISALKSCSSIVNLQQKAFSIGLGMPLSASVQL